MYTNLYMNTYTYLSVYIYIYIYIHTYTHNMNANEVFVDHMYVQTYIHICINTSKQASKLILHINKQINTYVQTRKGIIHACMHTRRNILLHVDIYYTFVYAYMCVCTLFIIYTCKPPLLHIYNAHTYTNTHIHKHIFIHFHA